MLLHQVTLNAEEQEVIESYTAGMYLCIISNYNACAKFVLEREGKPAIVGE